MPRRIALFGGSFNPPGLHHRRIAELLPQRHELLNPELDESSTEIRDLILHGRNASHLLAPRAQHYIERYGLYRGTNPATWSRGSLEELKCLVQIDTRNPRALDLAARF